MSAKRPVVGVMGGEHATPAECAAAEAFGQLAATAGWIVLCGGRSVGIMDAVARGAHTAGGFVVGVLPGRAAATADASAFLDLAIITGMGDARNAINVLSSEVVIACPGGPGTISEIALALKCGRSVILLGWDAVLSIFPRHAAAGTLLVAATPEQARDTATRLLAAR